MRYRSLDGLRGLFMLLMLESHATIVLGARIGEHNHRHLSWADTAHGFVFLSGLVAGIAYTGKLLQDGEDEMRRAVLSRTRTIYLHHASHVLALLGLSLLAALWARDVPLLAGFQEEPVLVPVLALGLSAFVPFLDILPVYVVLMAATPLLLRLVHRGHLAGVAAASLALWLLAQSGLPAEISRLAGDWLRDHGHPISLGLYFSLFGWQVVFVGGLLAGHLAATGRNPARHLRRPGLERAFWIALALFAGLAAFRSLAYNGAFGPDFMGRHPRLADKGGDGPIYILSLLVDGFLLAWLLVAGPEARSPVLRRLSAGLSAVLSSRPLVFLGRHSLQAFTAHILTLYLLAFLVGPGALGQGAATLLLLATPAPLFLAAWLHRRLARPRPLVPRPDLSAGPSR